MVVSTPALPGAVRQDGVRAVHTCPGRKCRGVYGADEHHPTHLPIFVERKVFYAYQAFP